MIAIRGIAGDQQAAAIRPGLFHPGYDEIDLRHHGCSALLNTGATPVASRTSCDHGRLSVERQAHLALEGSIFVADHRVHRLRDGAWDHQARASETRPLADQSDHAGQYIWFLPSVGLGAPYWNPRVRGGLFGLTRNTGLAELAHAALESVCYQTHDLWAAMRADWPEAKAANTVLRVDGGMTASDWTTQRLADLLNAPVDRPMIQETTALGAAYLAGLGAGIYPEPARFADNWRLEHRFKPNMSEATRSRKLKGWSLAVKGLLASDPSRTQWSRRSCSQTATRMFPLAGLPPSSPISRCLSVRALRADPSGPWQLRRVSSPDLDWFRALFRSVGEPWLWSSRLKLSDAALSAIIRAPGVEVYAVDSEGRDQGLLELDFCKSKSCEIAFFGLAPSLVGRGAGRWLMNRALERAWAADVSRGLAAHLHLRPSRRARLLSAIRFPPVSPAG